MKTRPGCSNDNWHFAEPDYASMEKLPRVDAQSVKEGDYMMVSGGERLAVGQVTEIIRRDGTLTTLVYQILHINQNNWAGMRTTRTALGSTVSTSSRKYRVFKPQPKPVPPPVVTATTNAEEVAAGHAPPPHSPPATLTVLAGIDAGIQTLCGLVREQNKILCALVSGASAGQDTAQEILEHVKEVWK